MSYDSVNQGQWCPRCGGSLRKTIEEYDTVCQGRGTYVGIRVSDSIVRDIPRNTSCNIAIWRGDCGHEFETSYQSVRAGSWCPRCAGKYIHKAQDYHDLPMLLGFDIEYLGVKDEHGKFNSELIPYKTHDDGGFWKCGGCGYVWERSFHALTRCTRYGCPNCSGVRPFFLDDYERLIEDREINGRYLGFNGTGTVPPSIKDDSSWYCNVCQTTFMRSFERIRTSYFCIVCVRISGSSTVRKDLNDYLQLPSKKCQNGEFLGICVGDSYSLEIPETTHDMSWWYCYNCQMEFESSYGYIQAGTWCRFCVRKSEKRMMEFLRQHFGSITVEYRQDWCINPDTGIKARFDFYLNHNGHHIIIELDGEQHFKQVMNWQSSDITRNKDVFKMKRALMADHSVIRISQLDVYNNHQIDEMNWKDYLLKVICEHDTVGVYYLSSDTDLYSQHIADMES
jgi:very-short-patch-repair endonuclease